jgi:hypothetical protein
MNIGTINFNIEYNIQINILKVPKNTIGILTRVGSLECRTFVKISRKKVTQARVFVINTNTSVICNEKISNIKYIVIAYIRVEIAVNL